MIHTAGPPEDRMPFILTEENAEQWFANSIAAAVAYLAYLGFRPDECHDIFQSAAERIWRRLKNGCLIEHPPTYLRVVLYHTAIRFRERNPKHLSLDEEMLENEVAGVLASRDKDAREQDAREDAREFIRQLLMNCSLEVSRAVATLIAFDFNTKAAATDTLDSRGITPTPAAMIREQNRLSQHKATFIKTGRRLRRA